MASLPDERSEAPVLRPDDEGDREPWDRVRLPDRDRRLGVEADHPVALLSEKSEQPRDVRHPRVREVLDRPGRGLHERRGERGGVVPRERDRGRARGLGGPEHRPHVSRVRDTVDDEERRRSPAEELVFRPGERWLPAGEDPLVDDSTAPAIELSWRRLDRAQPRRPHQVDELGGEIARDEQLSNLRRPGAQEGRNGVRPACDVGRVPRPLRRMIYLLPSVG